MCLVLALACASINIMPFFTYDYYEWSTVKDGNEGKFDNDETEKTNDMTSRFEHEATLEPVTDAPTTDKIVAGTENIPDTYGSDAPSVTDEPDLPLKTGDKETSKNGAIRPPVTPNTTTKAPQNPVTVTSTSDKPKTPDTLLPPKKPTTNAEPPSEPVTTEQNSQGDPETFTTSSGKNNDEPQTPGTFTPPSIGPEVYERTPITDEIRGVWVASVYRLDYPSASKLSAQSLKNELQELVDSVKALGMNAIFFQVRPTGDALYKSEIFPSSHWVTGTQGKAFPDDFDILEYLVGYAHENDIAVHAWINPYRVTNVKSTVLSKDNPAKLHPEWTFTIDGNIFYNPGRPEVIDLIRKGVAEIVENYDVDGIVFDDYFYPSSDVFHNKNEKNDLDYGTYVKYKGDFDDIGDWRRNNVNMLIKGIFETIKSIDPDCLFGVSPAGIWNNKSETYPSGSDTNGMCAYQRLFCDSLAWANGRYIDYLSPQIYWSMDKPNASFKVLAVWWCDALSVSGTPLIISYNANDLSSSETLKQVKFARSQDNYYGYMLYRMELILGSESRMDVIKELGVYFKKDD